jgi:uncharacterized radical SAM superfamily Fe-S cluster-containing enzyme
MERPADALTIPDVLALLEGTGHGAVSAGDFSPLPCSHPACFSLAFYLKLADGGVTPMKRLVSERHFLGLVQNRAIFGTDADSFRDLSDTVYEIWSRQPGGEKADAGQSNCGADCGCNQFLSDRALRTIKGLLKRATDGGYSPRKAMAVGESAVKSIFIHQFMDPHSFDLSRARKCCQVYPLPDGRMMPVCVYNCIQRGIE